MKISASYNFFNGDEHLVPSLTLMRKCVEHISIVWQPISNSGEGITSYAEEALAAVEASQLADDIILYKPDLTLDRHVNERTKRCIGLDAARNAKATHFLSVDADEFYRPEEFHAARRLIEENGWQSTSVNTFLHLKRPIYRSSDVTCCCFVTSITDSTEMGVANFPCPHVDPTRKHDSGPAHAPSFRSFCRRHVPYESRETGSRSEASKFNDARHTFFVARSGRCRNLATWTKLFLSKQRGAGHLRSRKRISYL